MTESDHMEEPTASPLGLVPDHSPAALPLETVRALNEKVAIIGGLADLLLANGGLDDTARAALESIRRQAKGVRDLFLGS